MNRHAEPANQHWLLIVISPARTSAAAEYNRYSVDVDEEDFNGQVTNSGPEFDTRRVGLKYQF